MRSEMTKSRTRRRASRLGVGLPQLDDGLDRFELNEVCVSHGFSSAPRRAGAGLG